jgi:hypothetical protein
MLVKRFVRLSAVIAVALISGACGQAPIPGATSLTAQLTTGRLAAQPTGSPARSYQSGQYEFYAPEQNQQPDISAEQARSIFERTGAVPSANAAKSVDAQFADFVNTAEALPDQAVDGAGPRGSAPVWQLVYHSVPMPAHGPRGSKNDGATYTADLVVVVATRSRQFLVAFTDVATGA